MFYSLKLFFINSIHVPTVSGSVFEQFWTLLSNGDFHHTHVGSHYDLVGKTFKAINR